MVGGQEEFVVLTGGGASIFLFGGISTRWVGLISFLSDHPCQICRGDRGVVVVFQAEIVPEYECVWQDVWAELGRPCGIHQKQVSSLCSHYFTF